MSLLNISTVMARRKELEHRVQTLTKGCDQISQSIGKIKLEAQSYIYEVNKCDPREMKELFLSHMKKLDEYLYLVSDINTLLENSETCVDSSLDLLPNLRSKFQSSRPGSSSLFFDALSEPLPLNTMPKSPKRDCPSKAPKDDCLIYFSSASTSSADLIACGEDEHKELTNPDNEVADQHASDEVSSTEQGNNDGVAIDNVMFIGEFPDMPAFHCPEESIEDVINNDDDTIEEEHTIDVNADGQHVDEFQAENAIVNIVEEHNPEPLLVIASETETGPSGTPETETGVGGTLETETDISGTAETETGISGTPETETAISGTPETETAISGTLETETAISGTPGTETAISGDVQVANAAEDQVPPEGIVWNFREMLHAELPIQRTLDTNVKYPAVITAINNLIFSIIIDGFDELNELTNGMNAYYNNVNNHVNLSREDIMSMKFCACGDETSNTWGRAFIIRREGRSLEVFFVDSGEKATAGLDYIQPLYKEFYKYPPLARSCQMAQLESVEDNSDLIYFIDDQLSQFLFKPLCLKIEDDESEFLAVVLMSPTHGCLNEIAVRLATGYYNYNLGSMPSTSNPNIPMAVPILREPEIDLNDYPQHDDPLLAVTGYHNRDEAEICRIYNGNPERGCRKLNCRKRHERMHPNGWTLDRVAVVAKHNVLPLPQPGTVVKINVTAVWHCNNVYVHILTADNTDPGPLRPFATILPPKNLLEMFMHMNNPASLAALARLPGMPAAGELVLAMYIDHKWYRARVIMTLENRVKIMFVDYGTVLWVDEDNIRKLEEVYAALPFQAVKARLVGYQPTISVPEHAAQIKRELQALVMDKELNAQVISRSFDEMEVNIFDESGVSIAERLYDMNLVELVPYQITYDTNVRCQVLPG